jgi:hypothetical protein
MNNQITIALNEIEEKFDATIRNLSSQQVLPYVCKWQYQYQ